MNALSSQIRTNAAISYFFLGPLFLLARNNPDFSHEFVRLHAKKATYIYGILLAYFVGHSYIVKPLLAYTTEYVPFRLSSLVLIGVVGIVFGYLMLSAYRAFQGQHTLSAVLDTDKNTNIDLTLPKTESEIVRTILAYVPGISLWIRNSFSSPMTELGVRISGLLGVLIILSLALSRGESAFYALVFLQILIVVGLAFHLAFHLSPEFLRFFTWIPSLDQIYALIRTVPRYLLDIVQAIIGKRTEISFTTRLQETHESDSRFESDLEAYCTERNSPFSPYLVYIPFINLIFISWFFAPGKYRYAFAVGQGIVLTILFALGMFVYGVYDQILILLMIPMILGLSAIVHRPFLRIPVLYEISWLISSLTFGLIRGTRSAQEKSKSVKEVSYKI